MSRELPRLLACLFLLLGGTAARAELMLTQTPIDRGFGLSTFATGFPSSGNVGPLGNAFLPGGQVMVADKLGNVRIFPSHADGQVAPAAAANFGANNAVGLAQLGGNLYMTQQGLGRLVEINANGTFNQVIASGLPTATGIVADPINDRLFVSLISSGQIVAVDPLAHTVSPFLTGLAAPDGLALSEDGSTLYIAELSASRVRGFDTSTKAVVFNSGFVAGGADGTALGNGILAGNLYANFNNGTVVEFNLTTGVRTVLATGGSRGDFVAVDPDDGTLLLTQTDRIIRLTAPAGGGFGGGAAEVPEPGSLALFGVAALTLLGYTWRRGRPGEEPGPPRTR